MAEWIDADNYTRVRVDGNYLHAEDGDNGHSVSMPLTPEFVVALRAQLAEWLAAQATASRPKRFVVDANDEDYVYVEESDGRVFALDAGGFLRKDGLPVGDGVTTYTPEA